MAYGLRFQTQFRNTLNSLITCNIYKKDYAGSSTTLRNTGVTIECNGDGEFPQVLTNGCNISIVNDFASFNDINEILYASNKMYKCQVYNDSSITLFEGYMENDIMEVGLKKNGTVSLEFSNGINKLEKQEPSINIGTDNMVSLLEMVKGCLVHTDLEYPIYINNTLTHPEMTVGDTSTLFEQTFIEPVLFFKDNIHQENALLTLKSILKPFNSVLYNYDKKWVIERYDDVNASTNAFKRFDWNTFACTSAASLYSTITLKKDYEYLENKQSIMLNAALNTINLTLNDKIYTNMVYNDYDAQLLQTDNPVRQFMNFRTWYYDASYGYPPTGSSNPYYGLSKYISYSWVTGDFNKGLYYKFRHTYNVTTQSTLNLSHNDSTSLYDMPNNLHPTSKHTYGIRYWLKSENNTYLTVDASGIFKLQATPYVFEDIYSMDDTKTMKFTKTINLDDVSTLFGVDTDTTWVWAILPIKHKIEGYADSYCPMSYVGDIVASVNGVSSDNLITATLNDSYTNTKDDNLLVYDCANWNYKNATYYYFAGDFVHTYNWNNNGVYNSIQNHWLKSMFNYYNQPRKTLNADIKCNRFLKPLTMVYDNTQTDGDGNACRFILKSYQFNPANNIYSVKAQQYPNNEITIA